MHLSLFYLTKSSLSFVCVEKVGIQPTGVSTNLKNKTKKKPSLSELIFVLFIQEGQAASTRREIFSGEISRWRSRGSSLGSFTRRDPIRVLYLKAGEGGKVLMLIIFPSPAHEAELSICIWFFWCWCCILPCLSFYFPSICGQWFQTAWHQWSLWAASPCTCLTAQTGTQHYIWGAFCGVIVAFL